MFNRREFLARSGLAAGALVLPELLHARIPGPGTTGPDLPLVRRVDLQPLLAQVRRLVAATDYLGAPLPEADREALEAAAARADAVEAIQRVLDPHCLLGARIPPGAPPVVVPGPAKPELMQGGWRLFLVKVPLVVDVEPHRLIAQVRSVVAAIETLGFPAGAVDVPTLEAAIAFAGDAQGGCATEAIQRVLDRACLVDVHINPEMRVKVARGPARPALVLGGWRPFLVKVRNAAGTTARLRSTSAQAGWVDLRMLDDPPLAPTLSGLELEYRILRLFSREAGRREAGLAFDVGQGTQDLGFRNEVPVLFDCR